MANQGGERDAAESRPTSVIEPSCSVNPPIRFVFVDGLRGFAALAIVLFHVWWYEPAPYPALESALFLDDVLLRLRGGVQVLLVISGFVIAYTLRNLWVTPKEIVSFVGRRIVRLFPAYWAAIGIVILADAACSRFGGLPAPFDEHVTAARVFAHMAFLQEVFDHEPLSAGMWTVCIEMQFYVVAVLGWWLAQRMVPRPDSAHPRPSMSGLLLTFAPWALASLFVWRRQESMEPWVTHFLCIFFLGMMTWWTLDRTVSVCSFATTVAVMAAQLVVDWQTANAIAIATSLAIFVAGQMERLHLWLDWRWLQYLGRISYSLYLIHYSISHLVIQVGWKFCGNAPTSAQACGILLLSVVVSIAAGHLLYLTVEAPSVRWAARMKHRSNLVD
ncbi:MAG: acyltransferase [Planctomycetia bacterium]|nr:acyltransferase [Planctomycetia bacterium]